MTFFNFDSKLGKRARVWIDELPGDALLSNESMWETHIFSGGAAIAFRKQVAIEVFQPFGASFHYGLLGGEYQPADGNELRVTVPLDTPLPDRLYATSLAHSLDTVTIGGLPEYATAIRAGIEQVGISARPCGVLNLTCMAHGEIGSAPIVFSSLARGLVMALCRSDQPASLDEAMALLAA